MSLFMMKAPRANGSDVPAHSTGDLGGKLGTREFTEVRLDAKLARMQRR